jgi:hypothetical protein
LRSVLRTTTQGSKCRVPLRADNLSSIPSISFQICSKMRHVPFTISRALGTKTSLASTALAASSHGIPSTRIMVLLREVPV